MKVFTNCLDSFWDANLDIFDGPKNRFKKAKQPGPDESDDTSDIESRRELAEQMGWDEEEMDLEEFEDYMNM